MILTQQELSDLQEWAYNNTHWYDDSVMSHTALVGRGIKLELHLSTREIEGLFIGVWHKRKSWLWRLLFGKKYLVWERIKLNEDGYWWDYIRKVLPNLKTSDECNINNQIHARQNKLAEIDKAFRMGR